MMPLSLVSARGGKTLAAEFCKTSEDGCHSRTFDRMYGGTCINIGCIPTKTLVHLARETPVKATWEERRRTIIVRPLVVKKR